jgi:hypothetical protein
MNCLQCGKPADGVLATYYHGDDTGTPAYSSDACDECGEKYDGARGSEEYGRYRLTRYGNRAACAAAAAEWATLGENDPWYDGRFVEAYEDVTITSYGYSRIVKRLVGASAYSQWRDAFPDEYDRYEAVQRGADFHEYAISHQDDNRRRQRAFVIATQRGYDGD